VFGGGPVGLLAAYSAILRGASRVYNIERVPSLLDLATFIGANPINFVESDLVEQILAQEPGGVRRSVKVFGYEAEKATDQVESSITLRQAFNVIAPRGEIGIVGLFSEGLNDFDIGQAFEL
jgi:threonine dehydrogenase-like Zn-dependent dehydrogenase